MHYTHAESEFSALLLKIILWAVSKLLLIYNFLLFYTVAASFYCRIINTQPDDTKVGMCECDIHFLESPSVGGMISQRIVQ